MDLAPSPTTLLVTDASEAAPLVLYDRVTGSLLDKVDNVGEGPEEVRRIWSLRRTSDSTFLSMDVMNRRIVHFEVANGTTLGTARFVPLPAVGFFTHIVAATKADGYILGGVTEGGRFVEVDSTGRVLRQFGELPIRRDNQGRDYDLRGEFRGHPDGTKAAFIMSDADIVELYDLETGSRTAVIWGPWNNDPLSRGARGYVDLAAGSDYLYALVAFRSESGPSHMGSTLFVFDWEGAFHGQIQLESSFTAVAVDESSKMLYLSRHEPTPAIVEADIPSEFTRTTPTAHTPPSTSRSR